MLPVHSDPEVLERIYEHFSYLADAPLSLRGYEDHRSVGAFHFDRWLVLLLADPDTSIPYRADHPGLSRAENDLLSHQQDLTPVVVWPQPVINVLWDTQRQQGVTRDIEHTDVILKRSGSVQLWWGGHLGVIFEALFDPKVCNQAEHPAMTQLWACCEGVLQERGVTTIVTLGRDPAFADDAYQRFLQGRGYRQRGGSVVWEKPT